MGPNTNVQLAGTCPKQLAQKQMDVSENSGTPKSSILIEFIMGTPIFGNTQMSKVAFKTDGVLNFSYFSPRICLFQGTPHDWKRSSEKPLPVQDLTGKYVIFQGENHWDVSPHPQMVNGNHQKYVENKKQQELEIVLKRRFQGWDIHHGKSSSSCIGIQIRSFCPGIVQNRKPSGSQYV